VNAAIEWLSSQRPAMQAAVATLVDIDSNSHDKAGTDRVAQAMLGWLHAADIDAEHRADPSEGDALLARLPGAQRDAAPVLLMGHRDTVFPSGTVAQRPWRVEGDRAYGPGVSDMKSGLVLQCFVLMALRRLPPLPFPVLGLFTVEGYECETVQLKPDDLVVVYSDGVTDAANVGGDEFGRERLVEAIAGGHGTTPETLLERVLDAVRTFSRDAPQADDMTVLVLRYR